ncbi:MAG: elongation factor G [Candidatus Melainabacteria bacterium]|nr:elongation factor G [Candidatus Melainabacteria bacterium]
MPTDVSKIRNVAFVGINKSGKTSLIEALLNITGTNSRRGKIQDGTCTTDYEPESIDRQISTQVSAAHTTYKGYHFNLIDCPGFIDFNEESKLALMGVDTAIFVVEPDPSRLIQMDNLLSFTEEIGVARMVVVNKMDKPDLPLTETLNKLKEMPGTKTPRPLAPLHYPIGTGDDFKGYVSVLKEEAFTYGDKGEPQKTDVPDDLKDQLASSREKLIESLADTDDKLLEMVLEGEDPPLELLEKDLGKGVREGTFVPILVASAMTDGGLIPLLDLIISLCPSPAEREYKDEKGETITTKEDGPVIAQVMKTYVNPQSGKISLVRVFSGTIAGDTQLVDTTQDGGKERIGGLYAIQGKKHDPIEKAGPGSIVGLSRMDTPRTGDTLVSGNIKTVLSRPPEPPPLYSLAIAPKNRNDEAKLSTLLQKLLEEDPVLKVDRDPDTHEYCLYGQGEVHLTLSRQRLERKYSLQLDSKKPQIAYKETIQSAVDAHGRHKKQTGGKGQFGEIFVKIEPQERGSGNKFSESIVGGSVPRQYIPGAEKGITEAFNKGPLAGFPVVDVAVNLYDGKFHDVDSDEMSFRMAGILAMKDGMPRANPMILEPIAEVKIHIPTEYTSGVLGQVNGRRGQILGFTANPDRSRWDQVSAHIPRAELWDYIIELRTLTQGLGYYEWKFSHLAPVPPNISQQLIQEATAAAEA